MSAVVAPEQDEVTRDRHTFIGGSEAHELLNEPQYARGCARALGYRKQQVAPDYREPLNDPLFKRGKRLEAYVAEEYAEATGRKLVRSGRLRRHPRISGAGVHVDRLVLAGFGNVAVTGDAEIKTHGEGPFLHILKAGLPPGHNLQAQWANFVTGHTWCAFIVLGVYYDLPLVHFDIQRDEELMAVFETETVKFWETLARGELPPRLPDAEDKRCKVCPWRIACRGLGIDPDAIQEARAEREGKRLLPRVEDKELEQLLLDYTLVREEIRALDDDDEEFPGVAQVIRQKIESRLEGMGIEHAVVGRFVVHSTAATYTGLDTQRLKADAPEIYERFLISKRPTGRKRLRIDVADMR